MAITITIAELLAALRLTDTAEELAEATRLHALASEITTTTAPGAVDVVQNECVIRLAAFLYDQPNAAPGDGYANAWRNSGAARLALPYIIHRAGLAGGDAVAAAQGAVGTVGNPVTDVDYTGSTLTVTFADGTTSEYTIEAGTSGTDQTARDSAAQAVVDAAAAQTTATSAAESAGVGRLAAAAAQGTADTNTADVAANASALATLTANQSGHETDANAHHVPPTGGGTVFDGGNLAGAPVAMRLGWAQSQTATDTVFLRADDHPIDGAAVGDTDGLTFPPFPPALNADRTLYIHLWVEGSPVVVSLAVALGGLRLDHFSSHGALTVGGVAGILYVSNSRLRQPGTTNSISLVIVGDAIASQPWVEEQIAAIPAGGGPTFTELVSLTANGPRTTYSADTVQSVDLITKWNSGDYYAFEVAVEWDLVIANVGTFHYHSRDIFYTRPELTPGNLHIHSGTFDDNSTGSPYWMRFEINRTGAADTVQVLFGVALNVAANVKLYGVK